MDLNEAAQRILRRHWFLIVLMIAIGVSIPAAMIRMEHASYVATARIVIGATDTRDGQEATALADTALALATSQEVVGRALETAGVRGDTAAIVEQVQVEPIGTSGVLELSVVDTRAGSSALIVNALATEIVRMRDEAVFAPTRQQLTETEAAIAAINQRITDIERAADAAVARLGSVDALALEHAQAMEQRSSLENQRQQLIQALTVAVRPRVIDASSTAGELVPAAKATRLGIGGVLGLILGIALAAARESFRPTLTGSAVARHLGAPLLARLPRAPRADTGVSDPWLANYLMLAADAAGVTSVQLIPVKPWVDVSGLADDLDAGDDGGLHVSQLLLAREGPTDGTRPDRAADRRVGIVAVTPDVVKGTKVFADVERHSELTRRPIIGVITYRGRARRRRPAAAHAEQRRSTVAAPALQ